MAYLEKQHRQQCHTAQVEGVGELVQQCVFMVIPTAGGVSLRLSLGSLVDDAGLYEGIGQVHLQTVSRRILLLNRTGTGSWFGPVGFRRGRDDGQARGVGGQRTTGVCKVREVRRGVEGVVVVVPVRDQFDVDLFQVQLVRVAAIEKRNVVHQLLGEALVQNIPDV